MYSPYYKDIGKITLASKVSFLFRKKMFVKFMEVLKPQAQQRVLDLGVTSDKTYQESNYFEQLYPYKEKITCAGTEDARHLETIYPGIKFVQIKSREPLPFKDNEFDFVFSNAVIEHVGSEENQRAFILEMLRVSKAFFLTTPNRWFPIEFHTAIPLLHFLPKQLYRKIFAQLGETYWSQEENLNLLSAKELIALFPPKTNLVADHIKLLGWPTNLIVYGTSPKI